MGTLVAGSFPSPHVGATVGSHAAVQEAHEEIVGALVVSHAEAHVEEHAEAHAAPTLRG